MRKRLAPRLWLTLGAALAGLCALALLSRPSTAQQIYRNGFESNNTSWIKGASDVEYTEVAHLMSEDGAHNDLRSEYLKLSAKQGTHIHYQLPTKRAPISIELSVGLWIKASRPGVQLMGRVVLPYERDLGSLDDRLTTLIRGDVYRKVGRWQRLELGRAVALAQQQQQLMQSQLKRAINFKDAYIDMLVLNVYGGPGEIEVWIDDLEMGPVLDEPAPATAGSKTPGQTVSQPRPAGKAAVVEFSDASLRVNGKLFFFRGIRYTDTPLAALRNAGFNTLWLDAAAPATLVQQASELGFRLVPALPGPDDTHLVSTESLAQEIAHFPEPGNVLFVDLGGSLTHRERDVLAVNRSAQLVRSVNPTWPVAVDAWTGLGPYSRSVNLLGAHRWPLMTALELPQYREWLEERRRLALPGTFLWTWIQTHAPDWYTKVAYDRPGAAGFAEPIGPQPEQIRLMTYQALAAGCKGVAFWSDRFLADSHQGRDRLLGVALLNQELDLLEPVLVTADGPPTWIETSTAEVRAAVFHTAKGVLVLPMWCGKGAQYVPGQAAAKNLTFTVPLVPQDMHAWEVTPGDVRGLRVKRVVGGTEVTLGEFGLTTAVVFTADVKLVVRFQERAAALRQVAAQWTYELALQELQKVLRVERELEADGHKLPDGPDLLKDAETRLRAAKEHWDNRMFGEAYHEAQRALRPIRILMRAQWDKATDPKVLDTPVASPYAVSFYTLPRHWRLLEQVRAATPGSNLLPGGGFEVDPGQVQSAWTVQELTLDSVELKAERVGATPDKVTPKVEPKEGQQCLKLQVKAKDAAAAPAALEGTFLAITSPAVHLQPGSLVQISGWINIPSAITGCPDGALLYDSACGEELGVRLTTTKDWKKFTLYRKVPAAGALSVTVALTGLGTVYFDDLRIESLSPGATNVVLRPQVGAEKDRVSAKR
jgi:hypothetical protein